MIFRRWPALRALTCDAPSRAVHAAGAMVVAAGTLAAAAPPSSLPDPPRAGLDSAIVRQLEEARSAVERVLAEDRSSARDVAAAHGSLGELYLLYDLAPEAERCLREASQRDPAEPRWPYLLGVLYQGEGDLDRAEAALRSTLALRPDDLPALLRLGEVLLDAARVEDGRAAFARALEIEPQSAKALDGLGRAAFAAGDYAAATKRFTAALELQPEARSIHYRLGMALRAGGDLDASRRHLTQSAEADGGAGEVTFPDPVLDASRRRITGVGALLLVGQLAARAGADATAEARFREALALDAKSPDAHHALGVFYEQRGRRDESLAHYREALELGLDDTALGLHVGRLLREAGRAEEAVAILERAAERAPDSAAAAAELAAALAAAGRSDRALEAYARAAALDSDPESRALVLFHRSSLLAEAGRALEAEAGLRDAVALAPSFAEAHFNLGMLRARRGDFAAAVPHLERAVELGAQNETAALSLGMALLLLDRPLDARARLETALEAHPDQPALTHLLARLLAASSNAAARDAERALVLARELSSAQPAGPHFETMAMALAALGRFDQAVEWQERAVTAAEAGTAPSAGADLDAARRRLALYREHQPVVDPWKDQRSRP